MHGNKISGCIWMGIEKELLEMVELEK